MAEAVAKSKPIMGKGESKDGGDAIVAVATLLRERYRCK